MAIACRPALALPENVLTLDESKTRARELLGDFKHIEKILSILDNAGVHKRHLVQTVEQSMEHMGMEARNNLFMEVSKRLCKQAAVKAMKNAGVEGKDIDLIITTSCTGFMIPSVCAFLMPELDIKPTCKRMPITELGCAAGAVSLSRAREYCAVYPGSNVLIVNHELCSLCFQPQDFSMQALVGGALFGDGVASVVVRDSEEVSGLQLDANSSYLFENSTHYMGFDIKESGFHLVLDKGIPGAVEREIAPIFMGFLDENGLKKEDVDFFCIHPGGRKLVDEISNVFDLDAEATKPSRDCLAEVGNLSSASVMVVLKNIFDRKRPKNGERGLLAAFGPGFSAEMSLTTWVERA